MKIRLLSVLALLLSASLPASAAELPGRWTAEFDSPIGVQKYVYEFKKAGDALTGEATFERSIGNGSTPLNNVKVDGDKISFVENVTFQDMPLRIVYTGQMTSADEIKMTRNVADIAMEQLVAKRVK